MKSKLSPTTAKPTTFIPIIDPPVKAIFNAGAKPVLAAWVVLTFDIVAAFIPK